MMQVESKSAQSAERSGGSDAQARRRENCYQSGLASYTALLNESAALRMRLAQTLRSSIEQLEEVKGPKAIQVRREAELKLLKKIQKLLMSSQVQRVEKTPGWTELIGDR